MVKNKDHPDWYHANHLGEMFEIYFETLLEYRDEEGEPLVVEADRDGLFEKYERNVAKYKKRAEESLGERQPWVGQYCMERWLWCELLAPGGPPFPFEPAPCVMNPDQLEEYERTGTIRGFVDVDNEDDFEYYIAYLKHLKEKERMAEREKGRIAGERIARAQAKKDKKEKEAVKNKTEEKLKRDKKTEKNRRARQARKLRTRNAMNGGAASNVSGDSLNDETQVAEGYESLGDDGNEEDEDAGLGGAIREGLSEEYRPATPPTATEPDFDYFGVLGVSPTTARFEDLGRYKRAAARAGMTGLSEVNQAYQYLSSSEKIFDKARSKWLWDEG